MDPDAFVRDGYPWAAWAELRRTDPVSRHRHGQTGEYWALVRHAEIVAFMSKLPLEGFVPGSDTGETKAKPEIWLDMDDFKAKLEKMQAEVAKLAEIAKAGDLNTSKAQLGEAGKACKACHDKYRNK